MRRTDPEPLPASGDREHTTAETDPIRVFAKDGKWLIDYGSYANGYHTTRSEAIETATRAARKEHRELLVEAEK